VRNDTNRLKSSWCDEHYGIVGPGALKRSACPAEGFEAMPKVRVVITGVVGLGLIVAGAMQTAIRNHAHAGIASMHRNSLGQPHGPQIGVITDDLASRVTANKRYGPHLRNLYRLTSGYRFGDTHAAP
jgi:hypothetical protein